MKLGITMGSLGVDKLFLSLTSNGRGKVDVPKGNNNFTVPGTSNEKSNKADLNSVFSAIDSRQIVPKHTNMVPGYNDEKLPTKVFTA